MKIFGPLVRGLAGVLILSAWPAGATSVFDNGTLMFFDNFESGDFNNATGGRWSFVQTGVTVTNAGSPGANEGTEYAQLFRDNGTFASGGSLEGLIGTGTLPGDGLTSGDVLLRIMVYIPSASDGDARLQMRVESGNRGLGVADFNTARAWVRPNGAGFVEAVGPGFGVTTTTVPYATDVWQEWDLDYVVGASTFTVSVNGISATGLQSLSSGSVDFIEFDNGIQSPGSVFLDAVNPGVASVPEPATVGLGAVGLCLLLARRLIS